jgi:hypothetical protein
MKNASAASRAWLFLDGHYAQDGVACCPPPASSIFSAVWFSTPLIVRQSAGIA